MSSLTFPKFENFDFDTQFFFCFLLLVDTFSRSNETAVCLVSIKFLSFILLNILGGGRTGWVDVKNYK